MPNPNALVLLFDGVEELEAIAPVDCLRRAGVETTLASTGPSTRITGRNGIQLVADCLLGDCGEECHDLILIPGGPGHASLLENPLVIDLLKSHHASGKLVGSICAGPVVLQRAGILEGKQFTSFPATEDILPGRDPDQAVVRDGNVITSQGAGTALQFALALVEALCGAQVQGEVAASICA